VMMFPSEDPLGLDSIQAFHRELDQLKDFDLDPVRNVAYLAEEVGEVASAVRRLNNSTDGSDRERLTVELGEELADCLAYLAKLANYADIDLQTEYRKKMQRNLERRWR